MSGLSRAALTLLLPAALGAGCKKAERPRLPTVAEMAPEVVVANYAPPRLRVFPDRNGEGAGRYLILGTEMPQLVAQFRPLAVVDRRPPPGHLGRAGELAWAGGHVVLGQGGAAPALLVYDRDARKTERVALMPQGPCTGAPPPLLQGDGGSLHGVLSCPAERRSYLFSATAAGAYGALQDAPLAAELFAHGGDGDYLLGGGALLRLGPKPARAEVAMTAGAADSQELLLGPEEVVLVDGAAGRLLRLSRGDLRPLGEVRFPPRRGARLRAALSGDRVLAVVAQPRADGTELFGLRLPLDGTRPGPPLYLGAGPKASDHELVPVVGSDEVRALLVRTHQGNTGPLVALAKLSF